MTTVSLKLKKLSLKILQNYTQKESLAKLNNIANSLTV